IPEKRPMEARVDAVLRGARDAGFVSQECGVAALTGCRRLDYRSVMWALMRMRRDVASRVFRRA
ncbi:hypothetical protein P0D73_43875, partial [Paraburkholderia sp. RL18-101-BIB-B]|uniref:hypothetical protein n=1 Tax=unclassified Paraburkholderia TaxID=2615204 RepID=UPI0038BB15DA